MFVFLPILHKLTRTTSTRFTQTGVRGQERLHQVRSRKLKLGEVPIAIASLPLRVDLVKVVVQRGLGVEDLLAGLALEPRLLGLLFSGVVRFHIKALIAMQWVSDIVNITLGKELDIVNA